MEEPREATARAREREGKIITVLFMSASVSEGLVTVW